MDVAADSDVILSMVKAGHPATRIAYRQGSNPCADVSAARPRGQAIRGQHANLIVADELAEESPVDKPAARAHCLRCNVRLADRGKSRRRRSAAKSDYCVGCAQVVTPQEVSASLRAATKKKMGEISDDLAGRASKPRKDALDKTIDMLVMLTGWDREEVRDTAQAIVSVANDANLGTEYKRMRQFMQKQPATQPTSESLWDEYQQHSTMHLLLDGAVSYPYSRDFYTQQMQARQSRLGPLWDGDPNGGGVYRFGRHSAFVLDVEKDAQDAADAALGAVRSLKGLAGEITMPITLDPRAIAVLTGVTI